MVNLIYTSSRHGATLSYFWSWLLATWQNLSPNILSSGLVSTNSLGKCLAPWLLNAPLCSPAICVCLPLGAGQVVHSRFLASLLWKLFPAAAEKWTKVNQNCKAWRPENQNNQLKDTRMLHRAKGNCLIGLELIGSILWLQSFHSYIWLLLCYTKKLKILHSLNSQ